MRIGCACAKAGWLTSGRLARAAPYCSRERRVVLIASSLTSGGFLPFCRQFSASGAPCQRGWFKFDKRRRWTPYSLSQRGRLRDMAERRLGIIMNGVTGRMGMNQHLLRSVLAIRADGGVRLGDGTRIMPDPVLVGRNREKLEPLARAHRIERIATDLDDALGHPGDAIYFDAVTTDLRKTNIEKAIAAGKHIYTEKPTATSLADALHLHREARRAGVKHGVVQDKLFLPGLVKLRRLIEAGFFGRILSVKGDFGYWVFPGDGLPAQRPSWNYRKDQGGGIILDMLCHWRYVLDNLFGEVCAVSCRGALFIDRRWDEEGRPYRADAEDAAYATFELEGGIIAQINSSWQTRVRRDDLLT